MLLDMQHAPRCLARTRRGSPCQSPAMKNGRCRMHGGTSSGAPKGKCIRADFLSVGRLGLIFHVPQIGAPSGARPSD